MQAQKAVARNQVVLAEEEIVMSYWPVESGDPSVPRERFMALLAERPGLGVLERSLRLKMTGYPQADEVEAAAMQTLHLEDTPYGQVCDATA